jgi:hypothetical protein
MLYYICKINQTEVIKNMKRLMLILGILGIMIAFIINPVMAGDYKTLTLGETKEETNQKLKEFKFVNGEYRTIICNVEATIEVEYQNNKLSAIFLHSVGTCLSRSRDLINIELKPLFISKYGQPSGVITIPNNALYRWDLKNKTIRIAYTPDDAYIAIQSLDETVNDF